MKRKRLDHVLVDKGLAPTRSQAESYIKLGKVTVNEKVITKPGQVVSEADDIKLLVTEKYVSRAALKLASIASAFNLNFHGKTVLDVGSSTGGFTDYALQHGANRVVAVDVGTDQLHPTLRNNPQIDLHEKTDIRDFKPAQPIDIVLIDVSFISQREILPHIAGIITPKTEVVAMVKPQFEAGTGNLKHKGVIKNERMRRDILKSYEAWVQKYFVIINKSDSGVSGSKGNQERFYLLRKG